MMSEHCEGMESRLMYKKGLETTYLIFSMFSVFREFCSIVNKLSLEIFLKKTCCIYYHNSKLLNFSMLIFYLLDIIQAGYDITE